METRLRRSVGAKVDHHPRSVNGMQPTVTMFVQRVMYKMQMCESFVGKHHFVNASVSVVLFVTIDFIRRRVLADMIPSLYS